MEYCSDPTNFNYVIDQWKVGGAYNKALCDKAHSIKSASVQKFFEAFSKGVEWVFEQHGTIPPSVQLTDKLNGCMGLGYEGDNHFCIYVKEEFFLDCVNKMDNPAKGIASVKYEPYILTMTQGVEAMAVEEAYHYAQYTKYRDRYVEEMFDGGTDAIILCDIENYHNHPLEKAAEMQAVRPYLKAVYGLDDIPKNMFLVKKRCIVGQKKMLSLG